MAGASGFEPEIAPADGYGVRVRCFTTKLRPSIFTFSDGHATPSSMHFLKECPFEMMRNRRSLSGNSGADDRSGNNTYEILQVRPIQMFSFSISSRSIYSAMAALLP